MRNPRTLAAIALGYVLALLMAWGALALYVACSDSPARQASAGMASFGDAFVFLGTFALAALAPTVGALRALRAVRGFWTALAVLALGVALSALACVLAWTGWRATDGPLRCLASLAPMRMLFAPLCACLLGAAAACAPAGGARRALVAAWLIESAAFAGFVLALLRLASVP